MVTFEAKASSELNELGLWGDSYVHCIWLDKYYKLRTSKMNSTNLIRINGRCVWPLRELEINLGTQAAQNDNSENFREWTVRRDAKKVSDFFRIIEWSISRANERKGRVTPLSTHLIQKIMQGESWNFLRARSQMRDREVILSNRIFELHICLKISFIKIFVR